ncbi:MAG TPA: ATP-dependent zinc metalloprotease FtsH [Acetobacteraceae bacterium]|nr:ATP-dependent zinc metalloprotease FtsH [Acetobacteraceae bacterium]
MQIKQEHQIYFWYLIAAVLGIVVIQGLLAPSLTPTIPYSQFQALVQQDKVTDLAVGPNSITGRYRDPPAGQPDTFTTYRVDPEIARLLSRPDVIFSGQPGAGFMVSLLSWFAPTILFVLLWMFLIRPMAGGGFGGGMGGGLMAVGQSKAKIYVETDVKVSFADVAGVDEAKDELKEIVTFLNDPQRYGRLGAHVPRGILLVGPPGTGKTLLARAVAGEAGVPFFSISGSEFVEMFVGVGAARVRDLFEKARSRAPAIVFIDELDALGRARGVSGLAGNDEKEQTLNQLLAELDGFDPRSGVVLLAATNRPEILDPALLRAGRFDRQVLVDRPDRRGRAAILAVHLKQIHLAAGVTPDDIAGMTPGFTGADLAGLVNEAALLATRRDAPAVTLEDFGQAIERVIAGLEKRNRLLNAHEREVVAHHEIGHALVALALPDVDPVQKISIIPRGIGALGYTIQRPLEDRFLMSRTELLDRMTVLLGGRAAERLIFEDLSTGAADDLVKATEIARGMVVRFGMDEHLGQVAYEVERAPLLGTPASAWEPRRYSDATASGIDAAVRGLIDLAYQRALAILQADPTLLRRAAQELLAHETLTGDQLRAMVSAAGPDAAPQTTLPRPAPALPAGRTENRASVQTVQEEEHDQPRNGRNRAESETADAAARHVLAGGLQGDA